MCKLRRVPTPFVMQYCVKVMFIRFAYYLVNYELLAEEGREGGRKEGGRKEERKELGRRNKGRKETRIEAKEGREGGWELTEKGSIKRKKEASEGGVIQERKKGGKI